MSIVLVLAPNTHHISYMVESNDNWFNQKDQQYSFVAVGSSKRGLLGSSSSNWNGKNKISSRKLLDWKTHAFWPESKPAAVLEMESILDSEQLDQALLMADHLSQPIIIDWMASWCRKCIYLKPKLEKLAAEYDTRIKFYCVDVNKVPQALVKRGNVSKMPTIQLWKDGEYKAEVIGGHKAWLVVDEVREMMQQYLP